LFVSDGSSRYTVSEAKKLQGICSEHILNTGSGGATALGLKACIPKATSISPQHQCELARRPEGRGGEPTNKRKTRSMGVLNKVARACLRQK